MPGAAGGMAQIKALEKYKPDVLVCGEISEWETAEYVRDARAEGRNIALVVTGHIPSEEAGSIFMAEWLEQRLNHVKITHINCGNSLSFA
jgi:putative NIF3 family GTP cyclohydrolase 1 type 2